MKNWLGINRRLPIAMAVAMTLIGMVRFSAAQTEESPQAAAPAKADSKASPDAPADDAKLSVEQARLADRYKELERVILRMAEVMQPTDPKRAALLKQAFAQSKQRQIDLQFEDLVKLLEKEQLYQANKGQVAVQQDLNHLLQLLMSGEREKQIASERVEIKKFIERINKLIREQQGIQGETEGQGGDRDLIKRQGQVADKTGELSGDLKKFEGRNDSIAENGDPAEKSDAKPNEKSAGKSNGKGTDKSDKDSKSDKESGGKAKDNQGNDKPGDKQNEKAKPSDEPKSDSKAEGKPGEKSDDKPGEKKESKSSDKKSSDPQGSKSDKPSDSQPKDGEKSDDKNKSPSGKSGTPQGSPSESEGQKSDSQQSKSDDDSSGRKRIRAAEDRMREARRGLEQANRHGAAEEQQKAVQELKEAKAELEEILRQMREEEIERVLAQLEGRFRKMLEMQVEVYEGTIRLDRIPENERDHDLEIESGKLSRKEALITAEADKTLTLLHDEGSSAAFLETVEQMREDMDQVAGRLARANVSQITQGIEQDIVKALEEMVVALQKAQKEQKQRMGKGGGGGGGGGGNDQPLVDQIAELKMIRALQMRVNTRTQRYSRLLDEGVEEAREPDLVTALKRLSEREERIYRTTRDIVVGKNK